MTVVAHLSRRPAAGALALVTGLTWAVGLSLVGCKQPAAAPLKTESAAAVARVETARVVPRHFEPFVQLTGEVQPTASVKLVTQVGGIVTQLTVEEGDQVKAGALVLAIDDALPRATLRKAEATVNVARATRRQTVADFDSAQKDLDRNKRLFAAKVVDEKTLDSSRSKLDSMKAHGESMSAQILQAQADVASARTTLAQYRLTAPISGVVARRNVRLHEHVLKDKQVVDIIDTSSMEIVINVPADSVAGLKKGGRLGFTIAALGGRSFDGEIVAVIPQLDPKSRTLRVRARIANADGALLDGMFAVARIPSGSPRDALAIPAAALKGSEGDRYVWVVRGETAERLTVTPGSREGDLVEVSGAIKANDQVVMAGADTLKAGARVIAVAAPATPSADSPSTNAGPPAAAGSTNPPAAGTAGKSREN